MRFPAKLNEWYAHGDSNPRPLPCQSIVHRFYNDLQVRGDCQSTRKSYKTYFLWVGLWVENNHEK